MASQLLVLCVAAAIALNAVAVSGQLWASTDWTAGAHATFYGGQDASGTMGGACGYGNLYSTGYGTSSTALSNPLFNKGFSCGACYQLQCVLSQSQSCYPGKSITVTATNSCPPGSEGGWCDLGGGHFDLAYPMFSQLAAPIAGVIPVLFRKVPCARSGGVRFQMQGNAWFDNVLVYNVAGDGNLKAVSIKGNGNWIAMSQNWGALWQANAPLQGQPLSWMITTNTGVTHVFNYVAPSNWGFGQTFEADGNM